MNLQGAIVAVDIGSAKIAAIVARPDEKGRLEVASLAYVPSAGIERGRIEDIEAAGEALSNVLGKLERHMKVPIESVYLSISSPTMFSATGQAMTPIFPNGRAVKRQDVHQLVQTSRKVGLPAGHEQILAIPREFVVDGEGHIHSPVGASASRLEVATHIVSCDITDLNHFDSVVAATGRKVAGMIPSSLGSGLGTLSSEGMELGATVIDIGAERTNIGIFMEGTYAFQAVLPMGSAHVTRDICMLLSVDWEEGERLKTEFGEAISANVAEDDKVSVLQTGMSEARPMQRKVLAEIIESRTREIFEMAARKIQEFAPLEEIPIMVVLTGGGSILRGTEQLCEQNLHGKRCKVAQPKVAGRFSGQVASPMLATIVGVARYALETDEEDLAPISGSGGWNDRFRMLISRFGGKK